MNFKAQVSIEYLIIIGISFAILLPAGYFFYDYSKTSNDDTIRLQIAQLGQNIVSNAESVYGLADGSMITLELRYPKNIRDIYILGGNELVIRYEIGSGVNEAVFYSKIRMSGDYAHNSTIPRSPCSAPCNDSAITPKFPEAGIHQLRLESRASYILIGQLK